MSLTLRALRRCRQPRVLSLSECDHDFAPAVNGNNTFPFHFRRTRMEKQTKPFAGHSARVVPEISKKVIEVPQEEMVHGIDKDASVSHEDADATKIFKTVARPLPRITEEAADTDAGGCSKASPHVTPSSRGENKRRAIAKSKAMIEKLQSRLPIPSVPIRMTGPWASEAAALNSADALGLQNSSVLSARSGHHASEVAAFCNSSSSFTDGLPSSLPPYGCGLPLSSTPINKIGHHTE